MHQPPAAALLARFASALALGFSLAHFAGCAAFGRGGSAAGYGDIPSRAVRVAAGDSDIAFAAPRDGRAWVGDDAARRILLTQSLRQGDLLQVSASRGHIEANGLAVAPAAAPGPHAIYFAPATPDCPAFPAPVASIPRDAAAVASGSGTLAFTAAAPGRLWLADDASGRILATHHLAPGDAAAYDPATGELRVAGRAIPTQPAARGGVRSFYVR